MGDRFVATVRFHTEGVEAELYQRLLEGKREAGLSVPDYIEQILAKYFADEDRRHMQDGLLEQFHGECQDMLAGIETTFHRCFKEHNAAVMGTLAGMANTALPEDSMAASQQGYARLPEESGEIPEGALDFLDGV